MATAAVITIVIVITVVVMIMVMVRIVVAVVIMTMITAAIVVAIVTVAVVSTRLVSVTIVAAMVVVAVVIDAITPLGIQARPQRALRARQVPERTCPEIVRYSRRRDQMGGKYAADHPTYDSNIAPDSHATAHHSSTTHVSFSTLDTVSTRDGFIDGGMLRRQLDTAAVERSRVDFPEDGSTSVHQDKPGIRVSKSDRARRFLTWDGFFPARFPFEVEMKVAASLSWRHFHSK